MALCSSQDSLIVINVGATEFPMKITPLLALNLFDGLRTLLKIALMVIGVDATRVQGICVVCTVLLD